MLSYFLTHQYTQFNIFDKINNFIFSTIKFRAHILRWTICFKFSRYEFLIKKSSLKKLCIFSRELKLGRRCAARGWVFRHSCQRQRTAKTKFWICPLRLGSVQGFAQQNAVASLERFGWFWLMTIDLQISLCWPLFNCRVTWRWN